MKETFLLLADYNAKTNREMLEVLDKVPAGKLTEKNGLFFESIAGTLNHLLQADVLWLERFAANVPELADVASKLPAVKPKDPKGPAFADLPAFSKTRAAADEAIGEAMRLFPEGRYGSTLVYRNIKGEEQKKIAWQAVLHFFNHQTHHRGQVAAALDQIGVQNDFSNLIWKF